MALRLYLTLIFSLLPFLFFGCAERSLPPEGERVNLTYPDDGEVLNESRILFDWDRYDNSNGYEILVWRADNPDSIVFDSIEFDSSVKNTFVMTNGVYCWSVGVRIGDGEFSHWSDTSCFTIEQTPFKIASWVETRGYANDVFAIDGVLYVADGRSGMSIVDANDVNSLSFLENYDWDEEDEAKGIFADGEMNILAVADYYGHPNLYLFDITSRTSPVAYPSSPTPYLCEDVDGLWMRDTLFLLAASKSRGLYIFDMGTPGFAVQRGSPCTPAAYCHGVAGKDTIAAVAADDAGVFIFNIANPDASALIGYCDTPGEATRLKFFDNYLYIADGLSGLVVIDVSEPSFPRVVHISDTQVGDAQDIAIAQLNETHYLALAIGSDGVLFYDITNPAQPVLLSRLETMYAYGVGADDRAFFIADRDWGIVSVVKD
ncbi:hypothetical protein J7M00_06735 [bacterium]|nr:hypothetical protein [bacterium]